MRYVAFGLQIRSPFALPGMAERTDPTLPVLELEIQTRGTLHAAWHATRPAPLWEGQLGDGQTLLVARADTGEHLFTYGTQALFALNAAGTRLACAPIEDGIAWQRVLLTKVLANVSLIRGYEALHASAVESPDGAVVVLAPSGTGKTALALALAHRGWPVMSDDILTLGPGENGVRAHPGTPHMNVDLATVAARQTGKLALVLGVLGDELWLAARAPTVTPCPVRAVCMLQRGPLLTLSVDPVPASPVALIPYMLGLADDEERERDRFHLYSELAAHTTFVRVTAGEHNTPGQIAERLRGLLETLGPVAAAVPA